jgi:hypothetical protein
VLTGCLCVSSLSVSNTISCVTIINTFLSGQDTIHPSIASRDQNELHALLQMNIQTSSSCVLLEIESDVPLKCVTNYQITDASANLCDGNFHRGTLALAQCSGPVNPSSTHNATLNSVMLDTMDTRLGKCRLYLFDGLYGRLL